MRKENAFCRANWGSDEEEEEKEEEEEEKEEDAVVTLVEETKQDPLNHLHKVQRLLKRESQVIHYCKRSVFPNARHALLTESK
jgi:hypothetical protein